MKRSIYRSGIILIAIGVVIGLLISAGMDFNLVSTANSLPESGSEPEASTPLNPQTNESIAALENLSNAFTSVAEKVNPSVVTIFTETVERIPANPFSQYFGDDDFWGRFFGMPRGNGGEREYTRQGLGSGVIVSSDGIIVTNNHVVKDADDIKIRLLDGSEFEAEVKGTDERTDLAVLKIDKNGLRAIPIGDSDKARVGAWVLAIGSPLSENLAHSVTSGIISAKGRSGIGLGTGYEDYIQTDAAINPGNSGGALTNLRGELIGINTAIASRTGGFMGIGFAIPSNLVKKVMTDILEKGRVVRGWLGVYIQNMNEELAKGLGLEKDDGIIVTGVQENSPAQKAGLKAEDIIIELDGRKVKNTVELSTRIGSTEPNTRVKLTILRDGDEKEISVVLGEYPEEEQPVAATESGIDIGIRVQNITPALAKQYDLKVDRDAVVITEIDRSSSAAQSGLRPGDVILKINRKDIRSVSDYNGILENVKAGDTLLFYIQRGEGKIFVAFTLPE